MGSLRIIAGELKGRRIAVPPGPAVRPTPDRVREALFSILADAAVDAQVLDAYSGSGALGFEALSRGAKHCTFLEADRRALRTLRANAAGLDVEARCTFLLGSAPDLLGRERAGGAFDLILADPPYAERDLGPFLRLAAGRLVAEGTLVLERDRRTAPTDASAHGLDLVRSAGYGGTRLDFYRHRAVRGAGAPDRRDRGPGPGRARSTRSFPTRSCTEKALTSVY